jgi:uncharacterized protein
MALTMTGEVELAAPQAMVWAKLNDAEVLKACIPGCETLTKNSETEFEATAKIKIGPVSAKFSGKVQLTDIDAPNGYTISGEGQGGIAGFAKGGAKVRLQTVGAATLMTYEVEAHVGGKIAQLGSRLIDGVAKRMADQFFERFAQEVSAGSPSATS